MQHKEWYTLMADVCSMQLLWHLGTNVIPAFQVLERFEHRSFIHVSTKNTSRGSHSEARQPSSLVLFNLPRFRLTFELHPGSSTLACSNYSGYSIPVIDASELQHQRSAVTLPLMRFKQFLLLHPTKGGMPVKLLVPDGDVTRDMQTGSCSIVTSTQLQADELCHHVYSFNERTLSLDTAVVHSRLFLAAIYAAIHCAVPIPQLGMTGGEHALQLLRQSWVNRPLAQPEAATLKVLADFSSHTPALQLLCQALHEDSTSLAFLHMHEPHAKVEWDPSLQDAFGMHMQEARQTDPWPFLHSRKQLTADEELRLLSRSRIGRQPRTMRLDRSVEWDDIAQDCLTDEDRQVMTACIDDSFSKQLQELQQEYCTPLPREKATAAPGVSIEHLMADAFGREVAADLEDSMTVFRASPPDMHVAAQHLPELTRALDHLLEGVNNAERALATLSLKALRFCPPDLCGIAMAAFQHAALMARPAQADLLRVTVFPEFLSVRSPVRRDFAVSHCHSNPLICCAG